MKTKTKFAGAPSIVALGIVCMLLFAAVSCRSTIEKEEEIELGDVPFTVVSLSGGQRAYLWLFPDTHPEPGSLIIINSEEQLASYIDGCEIPFVDFSKYSVLLVYGTKNYFTSIADKNLQRLSLRNYVMNVTLQPYPASYAGSHWHVAIITEKLDEGSQVTLNITRNRVVPIDVPFTEFSLLIVCECGGRCGWVRSNRESELTIINSDGELRRHVTCIENVPAIDFSRYTLLLVRGIQPYLVRANPKKLQQISSRNYVMNVNLWPGFGAAITHWHVAVITDKLDGNANVKLNVAFGLQ